MHPTELALNDYLEDALAAPERGEVERHLAECDACRALIDDLRAIRSTAAALDPLDPPARAWPRLERAIKLEAEHRRDPARASTGSSRATWNLSKALDLSSGSGGRRLYAGLAVAAAVLVAVGLGVRSRVQPAPPRPIAAVAPPAEPSAAAVEAELRAAEEHYDNAIKGLGQITNSEKGALDSQTAATLQKNLAVIDQAINESRAAVRAQPASEPAQQSLIESFKAKLALLQDTVALINEMRKGNEAGAARIGSSLRQKG